MTFDPTVNNQLAYSAPRGGIIGYDMPEHAASMKFKVLASIIAANIVTMAHGFVFTIAKKFQQITEHGHTLVR
jgi:hypothetical protein